VAPAAAIPTDFLTLAQAPMPNRKHWATDQRRVASIDDKFEAQQQEHPADESELDDSNLANGG